MHSNDNSLKSFYSALSTLDEDTLVDTVIIQKDGKNPLTKTNLAEHLANLKKDTIEFKDARMMQYIGLQQHLIQEQIKQTNIENNNWNDVWGKRKSIKNRVGYHGNHLGYYVYCYHDDSSHSNHSLSTRKDDSKNIIMSKKFKRMLGRATVLFRMIYKKKKGTKELYDDKKNNCSLISIGYDDWL